MGQCEAGIRLDDGEFVQCPNEGWIRMTDSEGVEVLVCRDHGPSIGDLAALFD